MPQAKYFPDAVGVTGVVLAKLDGTAKGGVIFSVCDQLRVPVRFVGTGERLQAPAPCDARKGGVFFSVWDQLRVPVRFVGTGERLQDLAPFEPREFVEALFAS